MISMCFSCILLKRQGKYLHSFCDSLNLFNFVVLASENIQRQPERNGSQRHATKRSHFKKMMAVPQNQSQK